MKKVIVVGGGLAGLSTASLLVQQGHQVILLEKMADLGGRCLTVEKDGFRLNFGAHAVYGRDRTAIRKVLQQLDIELAWQSADARKVRYQLANGELTVPPITVRAIWDTTLLPRLRDKKDFFRAVLSMMGGVGQSNEFNTFGSWLEDRPWSAAVKDFMLHLAGTNFFTKEPQRLPARTVLSYYQRVFRSRYPVSYVQGGWITIIQELAQYLQRRGGIIQTKASVTRLMFEENRLSGIQIGKKETIAGDAVVFCIPPRSLQKLVAGTPLAPLVEPYQDQTPNTVLSYDIALSKRIRSDISYVADLENHLFITDPSMYDPSSAPAGGQLLQAIAYTTAEEARDPDLLADIVDKVERFYDRHYPDWREVLVFKRVLEQATVQAVAMTEGEMRLPTYFSQIPNVFFAGDWCAGEGSVSDVAFHTARRVAASI